MEIPRPYNMPEPESLPNRHSADDAARDAIAVALVGPVHLETPGNAGGVGDECKNQLFYRAIIDVNKHITTYNIF